MRHEDAPVPPVLDLNADTGIGWPVSVREEL